MTEMRQELLDALAQEYPRWAGESGAHYAQRLAILAGTPREHASLIGADEDLERGAAVIPGTEAWWQK